MSRILSQRALDIYISIFPFICLILFNLVSLNNCYEVEGFSEFDIDESQNDWDDLEEELGVEPEDFNGLLYSSVESVSQIEVSKQFPRLDGQLEENVLFRSTSGRSPKEKCGSRKPKSYNAGQKYKSYMQRFVSLFLKAINVKKSFLASDSAEIIKLEFMINSFEVRLLQNFGNSGEKGGVKIEDVSDIFTSIFSQSAEENRKNNFDFNLEWMSFSLITSVFRNPEWTVLYSVLLMFVMTLWFAKTHSFRLAFFTLLMTIFFGGFGCNWIRMYEEKEVEKYVNNLLYDSAPYHCKGNPIAWYEVVFYTMFGEDCLEYYKTRDIPSMISVSPTDVLAETFSSMIVNPSVNIGKAYGSFIDSITSSVPFSLKPIAVLMAFIVPLMFLVVILCFLFDYQLSLSLVGFHLTPSWFHRPKHYINNSEKYIEDMSNEKKENDKECSGNLSVNTDASDKNFLYVVTNLSGLQKLIPTNDFKVENINISEEAILKDGELHNENKEKLHKGEANVVGSSKVRQGLL